MLKFLIGKVTRKSTETQRQTVERALGEINAIVAAMDVKPKVTLEPASGALALDLPQQMPDETLALPAPEAEEAEAADKEAA